MYVTSRIQKRLLRFAVLSWLVIGSGALLAQQPRRAVTVHAPAPQPAKALDVVPPKFTTSFGGILQSVDVPRGTVTVSVKRNSATRASTMDKTYSLDKDVVVVRDHKPGQAVSDLKPGNPGNHVSIYVSLHSKKVVWISELRATEWERLKSVDLQNNTITLTFDTPGRPDKDKDVTYELTHDCQIWLQHKRARLADIQALPPGSMIQATPSVDDETKLISVVHTPPHPR